MKKFLLVSCSVILALVFIFVLSIPTSSVSAQAAATIAPGQAGITIFVTPTTAPPAPSSGGNSPSPTSAPSGSLTMTKTTSLPRVKQDDVLQYTLTLSNTTTNAVNGVIVTDTLPLEVDYLRANATQGTYAYDPSMRIVRFDVGSVLPNQVVSLAMQVQLNNKAVPPMTISNTALLNANGLAQITSSVSSGVIPAAFPKTGK